jgi:hypothetical protein
MQWFWQHSSADGIVSTRRSALLAHWLILASGIRNKCTADVEAAVFVRIVE